MNRAFEFQSFMSWTYELQNAFQNSSHKHMNFKISCHGHEFPWICSSLQGAAMHHVACSYNGYTVLTMVQLGLLSAYSYIIVNVHVYLAFQGYHQVK